MMKSLNNYILEKLKINKNSKVTKEKHKKVTENMFIRALKNYGEVNLLDIYAEEGLPVIHDNGEDRAIKALFLLDKDTINYAYYNSQKKMDYEAILYFDELSEDDINIIYDYMLEN